MWRLGEWFESVMHWASLLSHHPMPLSPLPPPTHRHTHPSLESLFDSLTGLLHYFLIESVCIMPLLLKKSYDIFWIEFVIFLLPHRLTVVSLVPMDSNWVQMMLFFQPELRKLVISSKIKWVWNLRLVFFSSVDQVGLLVWVTTRSQMCMSLRARKLHARKTRTPHESFRVRVCFSCFLQFRRVFSRNAFDLRCYIVYL